MLNNVICCDISVLEYTCLMCTYQDKSGLPVFPLPLQFTFLISPALTFTCEGGRVTLHSSPSPAYLASLGTIFSSSVHSATDDRTSLIFTA